MSHYIRKIRGSLAGLLLPVFFLFVLGVIGIGAFPGWIQPVYSLPGAQCDSTLPCDDGSPLVTACNICNGEVCQDNGPAGLQCAIFNGGVFNFDPAATPVPACPLGQPGQPGCWTTCTELLDQGGQPGFCEDPICAPDDTFCEGISGGDESNECRSGVCQPLSTPDPANPSGCDYDLIPTASVDCRNCLPEGLATLENCGNGICEPDEGESCVTCSIDCLLPGFEDTCPLTTGPVIGQACSSTPPSVVFDGPPYNDPFSGECEDGDLCTDNACAAAAAPLCSATPKLCSINNADFCCPADCSPPAAGTACGPNDSGCDVDCYIPEDCIPTPSPTPPPPVFLGCLEGSGSLSGTGGPGCSGFACSLNTAFSAAPGLGLVLSLAGLFGLGAFKALRKRRG